ncbi:MAG TPA: ATP-binding protein [Candidatus Dormibacteraeota bacterium]|nr:ATP-binding protein [Candidatus Dormibacteraeota bacterium]
MSLGFPKVEGAQAAGDEGGHKEAILAAVEAWPGHLARELHDLVAQPLITLVLELNDFRLHGALEPDTKAEVARLEESARSVLRNTREMLVDLRGQGEIRLNFREVLKNELERRSGGMRAGKSAVVPHIHVSTSWPDRINGWAAFNLLRIVQEALVNAVRHGRAGRIDIILSTSTDDHALIVVLDDGAGIRDAPSGIGMAGMEERAVILGGKFSVEPSVTGGTRVEVRIPLQRLY